MPVYALWSAPRSRSTAFFRSMVERGDLLALHEPLEGLHFIGPLEVDGQTFESTPELLAWLVEDTISRGVFLKETVNPPVQASVVDDRRFLAEARHAFLIRRPQEIAASWFALEHDMRIFDTGLRLLHDLFVAVQNAGGHAPVVVDSADLVANPAGTMAAYCAAVELPFIADALNWRAGQRVEWARSSRWHEDAAASRGFEAPASPDRHGFATHRDVARFSERHTPFYDELWRHRLDIPPLSQ
jgi:sulfotransferase family protein